jgi:hypothetical protein
MQLETGFSFLTFSIFLFRFEKVSVVRAAKNPKTMDYGKRET